MLLLGVDPSKQLDHPLPTAHPHVTYAYMKYMWKSNRKVGEQICCVDGVECIIYFTFDILLYTYNYLIIESVPSVFMVIIKVTALENKCDC